MRIIPLHINEKQLIKKCIAGDRRAQKKLYERHSNRMLSICRQYVAPVELAEELMLNGFFKAFSRLGSYSGQGSFQGWLRQIMIRECIDYLRRKNPFRYTSEIIEDRVCEDEDLAVDGLSLESLQKCIDELPEGYRSIFNMVALDGFKHREIAKMLNIAESTSKTQYRKARLLLQERVEQLRKQQYEA